MTDDAIDNLRAEVMKGLEALRNGDYVEYTDETLPELVNDITQRGHARASQTLPNNGC